MQTITTVTTKGQITLKKPIRRFLKVNPSDRLSVAIKNNQVVVEKLPSLEEQLRQIRGMIKIRRKKPLTDKEMKKAIEEGYLEHYREKTAREITPKIGRKTYARRP